MRYHLAEYFAKLYDYVSVMTVICGIMETRPRGWARARALYRQNNFPARTLLPANVLRAAKRKKLFRV